MLQCSEMQNNIIAQIDQNVGSQITKIISNSYQQKEIPEVIKNYIIPLLISTFFQKNRAFKLTISSSKDLYNTIQEFKKSMTNLIDDTSANKENLKEQNEIIHHINWKKIRQALMLYQVISKMEFRNKCNVMNSFKASIEWKKNIIVRLIKYSHQMRIRNTLCKFYQHMKRQKIRLQFPKAIHKLYKRKIKRWFNGFKKNCQQSYNIEDYQNKKYTLYRNGLRIFQLWNQKCMKNIFKRFQQWKLFNNAWRQKSMLKVALSSPIQTQSSFWRIKNFVNKKNENSKSNKARSSIKLAEVSTSIHGLTTEKLIKDVWSKVNQVNSNYPSTNINQQNLKIQNSKESQQQSLINIQEKQQFQNQRSKVSLPSSSEVEIENQKEMKRENQEQSEQISDNQESSQQDKSLSQSNSEQQSQEFSSKIQKPCLSQIMQASFENDSSMQNSSRKNFSVKKLDEPSQKMSKSLKKMNSIKDSNQ